MKREIIRAGLILAGAVLMAAAYMTATDAPPTARSAKWQVATIMEVKIHLPAAGEDANAIQYDVTVRVGDTEYVVLYVPPDGGFKEGVKYKLGIGGLVLVGTDTIKYNDDLGNTREVRIISRRSIAANSPQS